MRIDPGGSLLYRAQGALKGKAFGTTVGELQSMLSPSLSPTGSKVFRGLTKPQLRQSAKKLLSMSDETIQDVVARFGPGGTAKQKELANILIARRESVRELLDLASPTGSP